jgi:hypothetical protein
MEACAAAGAAMGSRARQRPGPGPGPQVQLKRVLPGAMIIIGIFYVCKGSEQPVLGPGLPGESGDVGGF